MAADPWRIRLSIPPDTRFLHIVRLTVAGAAAEAGLDTEEVDDVKIAVDELCSVAVTASDGEGTLDLTFEVDDDGLRVTASVSTTGPVEVDEMGQAILAATVDTFSLLTSPADGDRGGFALAKSHRGR